MLSSAFCEVKNLELSMGYMSKELSQLRGEAMNQPVDAVGRLRHSVVELLRLKRSGLTGLLTGL